MVSYATVFSPNVSDVHAELQQSQELASELKKVKSTASTHAASLRRQEERQRQLEDIIVDLKHELDAAKASEKSAVETASAMKKDVARKELRYRQAAAAANRARDELANEKENRNNAVAAGHAELQATLKQVQNQANEAATAIKQAHDAQTRELRVRVEQLQAERDTLLDKNTELMERVEYAPVENQQSSAVTQPPGALVASNSSSLEAVVAELRTRNHRLQKALAHKFITQASDWKVCSSFDDCCVLRAVPSMHAYALCFPFRTPFPQLERAYVTLCGVQMMLDQKGQHGTSEFAQKAEIVERVQVDDKFRQDLLKVTERLTAVVQLNSELLVDNSKLTQQLQVCYKHTAASLNWNSFMSLLFHNSRKFHFAEWRVQAAEQMLSDARQRVAAAERLTDCHQARRSPLAALRQSSTSCCSAQEMIQEPCYPDVRQTATRVLQEDNQELLATVDSLRKGMHVRVLPILVYSSHVCA